MTEQVKKGRDTVNQKEPADQQETITPNKEPEINPPNSLPEELGPDEENWRAQQRQNWRRQLYPYWALVFISAGAVIAAFNTLGTLKETLEATRAAVDAAKDQAASAKIATEIAKKSFDQNVEIFRLDQRAWVGIKSTQMIDLVINKPLKAEMYLTNSGKTVARDVYATVTIRSESGPFDLKKFRQERPPPKGIPSLFVMFPNSEFTLPAYHSSLLTQERLSLIKTGVVTVYLFGEITYSDVFGKLHLTEFCRIYHPSTNDFAFCPEGDSAN